jgi:hypothetical protein
MPVTASPLNSVLEVWGHKVPDGPRRRAFRGSCWILWVLQVDGMRRSIRSSASLKGVQTTHGRSRVGRCIDGVGTYDRRSAQALIVSVS